jgi:hypothetical protein
LGRAAVIDATWKPPTITMECNEMN